MKDDMQTFFVKKRVEAKSIQDAIRREKSARVIEVWQDTQQTNAIGFQIEH